MKKHTPALLTLVLSLVAATTLLAQAPADIDAVTATPALRVQESAGVQYLNGGAGDEERNAMRALRSEFPLQIVFSTRSGAYSVAQQVRLLNGDRQVVAVNNAGPWLMVKVPPGRYTVEAEFAGGTQRRTVQVHSAPKTVHWATALASAQ